jgi:hypothetical protein
MWDVGLLTEIQHPTSEIPLRDWFLGWPSFPNFGKGASQFNVQATEVACTFFRPPQYFGRFFKHFAKYLPNLTAFCDSMRIKSISIFIT